MNAPFRTLPGLADARRQFRHAEQLRHLRRAAAIAREALENEGPVLGLASCKLVTFPYPTQYAFSGGALSPAPYVMMTNRMQVVQFEVDGARKTLLFNPTDYERGVEAPFYATLQRRYGKFLSEKVFAKRHSSVEAHLDRLGLKPHDVDFIAFDHLHVQDLRRWLGGEGEAAYFPRAKLLVQRAEWEQVQDLHPMNLAWYVPNGCAGVPADRLLFLDGDAWLGKGCAILSTPGHTAGNMSLAVVTDQGTFVSSENGVATESYTPLHSAIPGLRGHAEQFGHEVVLNGNTREGSIDQYNSMVIEKVVAGPSRIDPSFVNFLPSSELTASLIAPGLSPTFSHGDVEHGNIRARSEPRLRAIG